MPLIVCVSLFGLSSFSTYNFLPDTDKKPAEKPDQTVDSIKTSAPDSSPVLVNKQNNLPEDFEPVDLIDPSIPFIFNEKSEKRKMSVESAGAIETLFTAAKKTRCGAAWRFSLPITRNPNGIVQSLCGKGWL